MTIVYRRSRDEMPANPEEVEAALEEGIQVSFLAAPTQIASQGGKLQLQCTRMQLGEPDESGRPRPEPVKGSEFTMTFDNIIAAIGQYPEISEKFNVNTGKNNLVEADAETLATNQKGVFAGGDAVTGPASVIEAIAAGRKAASSIDKFLGGTGEIDEELIDRERANPYDGRRCGGFDDGHRVVTPQVPVEQRVNNFNPVELALDEEASVGEAMRCVQCDVRMPETLRRMKYGR